jgi:AcrR family transcriptional regulator
VGTTRDRFRAQVRDEIKQAALRQLAESGPQGLSVNAIAKQLGVSGPALYRYFGSRDELLTELVIDAYGDLSDAVGKAVRRSSRRPPADRFRALAWAYRDWALAQPHRYRLLFAPPVPGYDAHAERLVDAAQKAMTTLLDLLRDLETHHGIRPPNRTLARQLDNWLRERGVGVDPAVALRAVITWARLHGLVSLEIGGSFDSMGIEAERIFETEVSALL